MSPFVRTIHHEFKPISRMCTALGVHPAEWIFLCQDPNKSTWEYSAQQRIHEPEGFLFILGDDDEVACNEVHPLGKTKQTKCSTDKSRKKICWIVFYFK